MRVILYISESDMIRAWQPPDVGCYVRTQGAGALWVVDKHWRDTDKAQIAVVVDSIDVHEVPLNAPVYELPRPVGAEVVKLKALLEEAGMSGVLADVVGGMDDDPPQVWL